jgi:hypothetical protein
MARSAELLSSSNEALPDLTQQQMENGYGRRSQDTPMTAWSIKQPFQSGYLMDIS